MFTYRMQHIVYLEKGKENELLDMPLTSNVNPRFASQWQG